MASLLTWVALLPIVTLVGCERPASHGAGSSSTTATGDSGFAAVPDSSWVPVTGPTLIGFYPVVSNEQISSDPGLAAALDDFSYHFGTAIDSLEAAGFATAMRGGDTLWLRSGKARWRVLRAVDSATIGYVFADPLGRRAVIYGVRSYLDLVEYAHEFRRIGAITPR
jgi:hypothetical protein